MPFSEGTVLQLHGILYRYMPQPGGHWKATNNDIVERHPDGSSRIRFRPVAAHLTPMAMADLIARYRTALDQHLADPLVLVPLVILDFLCIHPFPDGNGRMARLLTLQLLYHFDYAVGRFISLERIFEESKESYYETLEASSQGWHEGVHDIAPWLNYFWGALLRAYSEFEERVGTIERGRGAKGDRVRAEILKKRNMPFSISEIEEACPGISRDMVRVVLRAMKAEGLIRPRQRPKRQVGKDTAIHRASRPCPAEFIREKSMNPTEQQFLNDLEKRLWTAADKLRSNLDPGDYMHVVLGLVFLKYVSDAFKERQRELQEQLSEPRHDYYMAPEDYADDYAGHLAAELEVRDYYTEKNVFWVP